MERRLTKTFTSVCLQEISLCLLLLVNDIKHIAHGGHGYVRYCQHLGKQKVPYYFVSFTFTKIRNVVGTLTLKSLNVKYVMVFFHLPKETYIVICLVCSSVCLCHWKVQWVIPSGAHFASVCESFCFIQIKEKKEIVNNELEIMYAFCTLSTVDKELYCTILFKQGSVITKEL